MYQALYRAYRPETFETVWGQEHIIRILKNQIRSGSVSHAYLFCGTRGTGKTTLARILAKAVNCVSPGEKPCGVCSACREIRDGVFLDVMEIDAASNNGVDNIRELRESVKYPPASGMKKVYIIDEVHMLSSGAFNALLKTLEEPPESVMFILATTEPHKLPATILSRCLRLDFRRVPEAGLKTGMKKICEDLGVEITESALGLIAAAGDGSARDSLSILDQCLAAGDRSVSREDVLEYLGTAGEEVFAELTDLVRDGKTGEALRCIDRILADGRDARQILRDWTGHYRNLMLAGFVRSPEDMMGLSAENADRIRRQSERTPFSHIRRAIVELSRTLNDARWTTQPRILLELCAVTLSAPDGGSSETTPGEKKARSGDTAGGTAPETGIAGPAEKAVSSKKAKPEGGAAAVSAPGRKRRKEETGPVSEEEAPPQGEQAAAPDPETLWRRILQEGGSRKNSFKLLQNGVSLIQIGDDSFTLEAAGEIKKGYVEENRKELEQLMESFTGRYRTMRCGIREEAPAADPERKAEELKANMEKELDVVIELK